MAVLVALGGFTAVSPAQVCVQDVFSGNTAENDFLKGFSVDISGDFAVAMGVVHSVFGISVVCPSVYRRAPDTGHWRFMQALVPKEFQGGDATGLQVAMDEDLIVVSSRRWNSTEPYTGALTVFRLDHFLGSWVQEASLVTTHGVVGDEFDTRLAVSGNVIVADLDAQSCVVFQHDPATGTWSEVVVLDPPRPPGYNFRAYSLATDGRTILFAGLVENYVLGNHCSCVFAYERDQSGQWGMVQTISSGEIDDLGLTMDMDRGVAIMASVPGPNLTLRYDVFRRDDDIGIWVSEGLLPLPSAPLASPHWITRWVAVDGDIAVVGDRQLDQSTSSQGAAHVCRFDRDTRSWRFVQTLVASDKSPAESDFGFSTGVSNGRLVVGSVGFGLGSSAVTPGVIHFFETDCQSLCLPDIAPLSNPNGEVNVDDLLAVITAWGVCPNPANCPADIAPAGPPVGNDVVNVHDLLAVINGWGMCP